VVGRISKLFSSGSDAVGQERLLRHEVLVCVQSSATMGGIWSENGGVWLKVEFYM